MRYWNQSNFEGLKSIGEQYADRSGFAAFSRYCLLAEKGLRKPALAAAREFIIGMEALPVTQQRACAEELTALSYRHAEVHRLLPHPLRMSLKAILQQWTDAEPDNPIPWKWLGYLVMDLEASRRAHELDPGDEISLGALFGEQLNQVDFQTHHLCESCFLGEESEAEQALDRAESLLAYLENEDKRAACRREVDYFRDLLAAWRDYTSTEREETFPRWCEKQEGGKQGKSFRFWSIHYYR